MVVDGVLLVTGGEVEDPPRAAPPVQPQRNTSPPVKVEMNISSSGAGISKYSPYISCCSITIGCGTP